MEKLLSFITLLVSGLSESHKMELQNNRLIDVLDSIVFGMLRRGDNIPNTHPSYTNYMSRFKFVIFSVQSAHCHIILSLQHSKGNGIQRCLLQLDSFKMLYGVEIFYTNFLLGIASLFRRVLGIWILLGLVRNIKFSCLSWGNVAKKCWVKILTTCFFTVISTFTSSDHVVKLFSKLYV